MMESLGSDLADALSTLQRPACVEDDVAWAEDGGWMISALEEMDDDMK